MSNTPNFECGIAKDSKKLRDEIKAIEIQISNNQELEADQLEFIKQSFGQLWKHGQLKILTKNGRPKGSSSSDISIYVNLAMNEVLNNKAPIIKTIRAISDSHPIGFDNLKRAYYAQKNKMDKDIPNHEQQRLFIKYAVTCYESV